MFQEELVEQEKQLMAEETKTSLALEQNDEQGEALQAMLELLQATRADKGLIESSASSTNALLNQMITQLQQELQLRNRLPNPVASRQRILDQLCR